jgi:hypothetical protein
LVLLSQIIMKKITNQHIELWKTYRIEQCRKVQTILTIYRKSWTHDEN